MPIDGLGSNPLRELRDPVEPTTLPAPPECAVRDRKAALATAPWVGPSMCAPCWHDRPARTTRMCPSGLPRLSHLTTRQLRTRSGRSARGGEVPGRGLGEAGIGNGAGRPAISVGPPQATRGPDAGGPAARRRCSAGGTHSSRLSAFFRPLRLAPHDERRDQRTEQAGDQDHQDQRRLAVEHPEIDADPMEVAQGEPDQQTRPPRPRSVGPVGAGRGAPCGRHQSNRRDGQSLVPLGPVCRAGGRSARISRGP